MRNSHTHNTTSKQCAGQRLAHCFVLYTLLTAFLFLFIQHTSAASFIGAKYLKVKIEYQSVDTQNRPITLSAEVYYPTKTNNTENYQTVNYIMLNNHPTITSDAQCPSGSSPQMDQVYYMTTEQAMVVCPDYLGFGSSKSSIHPYMCQTISARNCIDAFKAAMEDAKKRGVQFSPDYYTINVGYSQGGTVTLGVQRYLELDADEETRNLVRLKNSICGAGCYSQMVMADTYENAEQMDYPIYLPYLITGLLATYGEGCMHGLTVQDCFTQKFLESGLLEQLLSKETDVDALNAAYKSYFGGKCTFYDIVSADFRDHSSRLYRSIRKALEKNDIIEGWTPQHPITFYHYKQDEVVPYAQTERAMAAFAEQDVKFIDAAANGVKTVSGEWAAAYLIYGNLKDNHRDYGTRFYIDIFAGVVR